MLGWWGSYCFPKLESVGYNSVENTGATSTHINKKCDYFTCSSCVSCFFAYKEKKKAKLELLRLLIFILVDFMEMLINSTFIVLNHISRVLLWYRYKPKVSFIIKADPGVGGGVVWYSSDFHRGVCRPSFKHGPIFRGKSDPF